LLKAYLDIEGIYKGDMHGDSIFRDYGNWKITMIGMLCVDEENGGEMFVQLVDNIASYLDITRENFLKIIKKYRTIITYNGRWWKNGPYYNEGFDCPVIAASLDIDWEDLEKNHNIKVIDLTGQSHFLGLFGGMKSVEKQLNITRKYPDRDGFWSVETWEKWEETGDKKYFFEVLEYNKEDCYKLREIEEALSKGDFHTPTAGD
jgi:uncharacterized protein YprB with RNaseH-like and TPR domain